MLMMSDTPQLMGIINATPDSFSGDGSLNITTIVAHAVGLYEAGANIIDIGGESTRPGSVPISAAEEQRRVIPVVEAIAAQVDCPISIDTYRPETAAAALAAGATIINDVKGGAELGMLELMAERGCKSILMHNMAVTTDNDAIAPSFVGHEQPDFSPSFLSWLVTELKALADKAVAAGVQRRQLIIDPGIGFGKTVSQNLQIVKNAGWLEDQLSLPILLGFSNKSFIGKVLQQDVGSRLPGNLACVAMADCAYLRMHDVASAKQFLEMRTAIRDATDNKAVHY